jgi:hypothetical protein
MWKLLRVRISVMPLAELLGMDYNCFNFPGRCCLDIIGSLFIQKEIQTQNAFRFID